MHLLYGGRGASLWRRDMEGGDQKAPRKEKGAWKGEEGQSCRSSFSLDQPPMCTVPSFPPSRLPFSCPLLPFLSFFLSFLLPHLHGGSYGNWWPLWLMSTPVGALGFFLCCLQRWKNKAAVLVGNRVLLPTQRRYVYLLKYCCPLCVHPPDTNIYIHRFIMKRRTTNVCWFQAEAKCFLLLSCLLMIILQCHYTPKASWITVPTPGWDLNYWHSYGSSHAEQFRYPFHSAIVNRSPGFWGCDLSICEYFNFK